MANEQRPELSQTLYFLRNMEHLINENMLAPPEFRDAFIRTLENTAHTNDLTIAEVKEGAFAMFSALANLLEIYDTTHKMSKDEFAKAHPGLLDPFSEQFINDLFRTHGNEIPDQLTFFDTPEMEQITPSNQIYSTLPTAAAINLIKQILNNPTRIESPRRGRIAVSEHYLTKDMLITYKGNDSELTLSIERVKELFSKRVQNGAKFFNFVLEKLNEQNYNERTEFLLDELVDAGIYASPASAFRGLKTVTDKLMRIHVEGKVITYRGKKKVESTNVKAAVIAQRNVTYNQCFVVLPPLFREGAPSITILPRWGYTLQNENAYMLLDYIYYLARQNTNKIKNRGYFTIGLDTVRQHLGLPSPEEVKESFKSEYSKLIIKPIEDAITAIEDKQEGADLKITPIYDAAYKNIHEYLDGYLEIILSGEAYEYMKQRALEGNKRQAETRRLEGKKNSGKQQ